MGTKDKGRVFGSPLCRSVLMRTSALISPGSPDTFSGLRMTAVLISSTRVLYKTRRYLTSTLTPFQMDSVPIPLIARTFGVELLGTFLASTLWGITCIQT